MDPLGVTAAALLMQFCLLLILAIASAFLALGSTWDRGPAVPVILFLALVSIGALLFSQDLSAAWGPVLGADNMWGIPLPWAMALVFCANAFAIFFLVQSNGGAMASAFTPAFFALPPLAIFLQEPLWRVLLYVTLVGLLFCFALAPKYIERANGNNARSFAFAIVSLACLALTTLIGFVTRPGV